MGKRLTLYLLHVSGEALRLVLRQSLGLIPACHLSNGLLEELGQLQLSSKALLLLLFLQTEQRAWVLVEVGSSGWDRTGSQHNLVKQILVAGTHRHRIGVSSGESQGVLCVK